MSRSLQNRNEVSLCHKDNCIRVNGKNADLIAFGAFTMLFFIGIAALTKRS